MIMNKMQWALLIIFMLLTILALILPLLAYCLTGNWLTLTSSASTIPLGYVWNWIVKRVFPLNEQDHERELARISRAAPGPLGNSRTDLYMKAVKP